VLNKRILFIGTGYMGEGILKGVIKKGVVPAGNIIVYNRNEAKSNNMHSTYGVHIADDPEKGMTLADIIIIAVKPQDIGPVLEAVKASENSGPLIISVASGIRIKSIEEAVGYERRIVRVMPNPIFESGYGTSALNWNRHVNKEDQGAANAILSAIGETMVLKEELFNSFTGLSASGCAYIFEFMEAMMESGVLVGFNMEQALEILIQNFKGAAKMMEDTKNHPAIFKGKIASPAGTTIAGLHVLNRNGFKGIIQECVNRTVERAEELGK
jgi:pyrroline-5-carboxylate reductase